MPEGGGERERQGVRCERFWVGLADPALPAHTVSAEYCSDSKGEAEDHA